jgi:1,4-alpha-glucan branching enzyme
MVSQGSKPGTVRVAYQAANGVSKVHLAGTFNNWRPSPMRKQKGGLFTATVQLAPGIYEYKFLVDGQWTADPDHTERARNSFGTFNSVLTVTAQVAATAQPVGRRG